VHSRDFRRAVNGVSWLDGEAGKTVWIDSDPRKEKSHMAIESHLAELERRHHALEQEISEALAHPSSDDLTIAELKRKKLHVKDEIERLKQEVFVLH
jgi:hypothetical protein